MKTTNTSISITQTISRAFIVGTLFLLVVNWIIFRSIILLTENTVNSKRLSEVSDYHLAYYAKGNTGIREIDPLTKSYDSYETLPDQIQQAISPDWIGVMSQHYDDTDNEYVILGKQLNNKIYYLVESSDANEWSDDTFLIIEATIIIGGLILLLCARVYILTAANRISLPFRSMADQLSQDQATSFEPLSVEGEVTNEMQQTLTAINSYRQTIARSITREKSFTRYISHELRTPMTVIKGSVSLLNRIEHDKVKPQTTRIDKAVNDMHELTDTLLLLAREENHEDLSIIIDNKFIQQELDDIASYIDNNQCTVDYQLLDNMTLHAHPSLFKALFKNLLINAVNSTAQGQVSIFLDQGQLSIIDNGIGLEAESRGYQGFGIGLVIVKDICQKYGWAFSLTNNETQGCTAKVNFSPN